MNAHMYRHAHAKLMNLKGGTLYLVSSQQEGSNIIFLLGM